MSNGHAPHSPQVDDEQVQIRADLAALPAYVPGARPSSERIAKLSSNEMTQPPHPHVQEAMAQAASDSHRYPEMTGDSLCRALAEYHGVDAERIVVGNGSVALIQHLLDAVCEPGSEVVMPWRSFEAYPICVTVAGATAIQVPMTAEAEHDADALCQAITSRTRVLLLCTPNNPTGPVLSQETLRSIIERVPARVLIMVDEAYIDFVTDPRVGTALDFLDAAPNVVVARTFSKAGRLAGLRVGYLVGEPRLMAAVRSVSTPFGVNAVAAAAACASLEPEVMAERAKQVAQVVARREQLCAALRAQGWQVPQAQGNFVWLPVGEQAAQLAAHFREHDILVRPFTGEGVRITVGTAEEVHRVIVAAAAYRAEPAA